MRALVVVGLALLVGGYWGAVLMVLRTNRDAEPKAATAARTPTVSGSVPAAPVLGSKPLNPPHPSDMPPIGYPWYDYHYEFGGPYL